MSTCVAALIATVRLFSSVFHHVALQLMAHITGGVTHFTTVWFLSAVDPVVYLQIFSCNGGEAALATHMESLARLFRLVDIQVAGISTGVVTPGALEVLQPCVSLCVFSKVT